MSSQDYLILLVGLGVITWILWRPLAGLRRFVSATVWGHDESRTNKWRFRILLGAVFIPPVGTAICNFLSLDSQTYSNTLQALADLIPGIAWIVYAAWISKRQNRWVGIAKFGLVVLFARVLTTLMAYLVPGDLPGEFFWQFQWYQIQSEIVHLFGAIIFLMIGGRIFRFHLVRHDETELEPPRLTIPFLMLTQAMLAISISLMAWAAKSETEAIGQTTSSIRILMAFCFCLSTALFAFAIFLPSRIPRWALISTLIIIAVGLRVLVLYLWYREMISAEDHTPQLTDQILNFVSRQMAVQSILMLGVFVLIRFLFRKAGLVIVRAGFPAMRPA